MSDIWPDNLVEELAYRRCLIFLGSGISATAKNDAGESPDTWGAFLDNVKSKMKNPSDDDKKFVEDMLKKQNYLLALQAISDLCDSGEYSNYLKNQYLIIRRYGICSKKYVMKNICIALSIVVIIFSAGLALLRGR